MGTGREEVLPRIDEHAVVVEAGIGDTWTAVLDTVDAAFSRAGAVPYARAVACTDRKAAGPRPLTEGSTIPGFHVRAAMPNVELVLDGRHRFSTYSLRFRLDEVEERRSRVTAETRAVFPGAGGAVYRMAMIGSGGHAVVVRRLLGGIKRRAEA